MARYIFDVVANALIWLDLQVLALAGTSCDADTRDWDVVRVRAQIELVSF